MRRIADEVIAIQLLAPLAQAATVSGTGVSVIGGESPAYDAVAIVNVGAVTGAPDSFSVIVTIEESATVGGAYTTNATFGTMTAGSQILHLPVTINPAKPCIRATATIAFVAGTSPKIPVSASLLVHEQTETSSNRETAA